MLRHNCSTTLTMCFFLFFVFFIKDRTLELDRHSDRYSTTLVIPPTSLLGLGYVVKGGAAFNIIEHAAFLCCLCQTEYYGWPNGESNGILDLNLCRLYYRKSYFAASFHLKCHKKNGTRGLIYKTLRRKRPTFDHKIISEMSSVN